MSEKCVEIFGDPQFCERVKKFSQLHGRVSKCVKRREVGYCYSDCLKRCQAEGCEEECLGVMELVLGAEVAEEVADEAVSIAAVRNISPVVAAAIVFNEELNKVKKKRCPNKAAMARILAAAAFELYEKFKRKPTTRQHAQDVLLLVAPALAEAYQCVGESAFRYIDVELRPFVKEKMLKRIAAAMEKGAVAIGDVKIKFKPVRAGKPLIS
jgi:nitrate reductase NapAB chaperone NapD